MTCDLCGHIGHQLDPVVTTDGVLHCDDAAACSLRMAETMATEPMEVSE